VRSVVRDTGRRMTASEILNARLPHPGLAGQPPVLFPAGRVGRARSRSSDSGRPCSRAELALPSMTHLAPGLEPLLHQGNLIDSISRLQSAGGSPLVPDHVHERALGPRCTATVGTTRRVFSGSCGGTRPRKTVSARGGPFLGEPRLQAMGAGGPWLILVVDERDTP